MKKYLQSLILLFTFIQIGISQIPNDNCAGASTIFLNEEGKSVLIDAQLEFAHPSYEGANECLYLSEVLPFDIDRWYSFVAKGEVSRVKTSNLNQTYISIYEGECGVSNPIACNSDPFPTVVGERYLLKVIRINDQISPSQAFAQFSIESSVADTNLDCATATMVPIDNSEISVAGNFTDSGTSSACDHPSADVWFSFVAPSTGSVLISPISGSALKGEVYSGTCGGLSQIVCLDTESKDLVGLIPEDTYYIRVAEDLFTTGFILNESSIVEAPNVTCETATFTAMNAQPVDIDKRSSNEGYFWFRFTAPASGDIQYLAPFGISLDTYLDDCNNPELLTSSFSNAESRVFGLIPGENYLVRVKSFNVGNTFTFGIEPSSNGAPNNFCSNRIALSVSDSCNGSNDISGSFARTNPTVECLYGINDLWYEVIAPVSGKIDVNYISGNQFSYVYIDADCNSYTLVDENNLIPGNTYFFVIGEGWGGSTFTFCLSEGAAVALPNEICQDATEVFMNIPVPISHENAKSEETQIAGCDLNKRDLWYKFTATSTAVDISLWSTFSIEIFEGTCGSFSPLEVLSGQDRIVNGLVVGNTYYLRTLSNRNDDTNLTIDEISMEVNDQCTGAILMSTQNNYGGISYSLSSEPIPTCINQSQLLLDSWYKFTATTTAVSTNGDAEFVLYSGTCGSLQEVGCIIGDVRQIENLNIGSEYHLRQFGTQGVDHDFYFEQIEQTPNSICDGSINIPIWDDNYQEATVIKFNDGSTTSTGTSCSMLFGKWYHITGPTDGGIRLVSTSASMAIEIFDDCNGSLVYCQELVKNEETETINLIAGTNYKVRVSHATNDDGNINIRTVPMANLDSDCSNAVAINISSDDSCDQILAGSSEGAMESIGSFCGSNSSTAVFYNFISDENANYSIEISNSAAQHKVSVFTDCNLNTPIACGVGSIDALLVNGSSYIIAVYPEMNGVTSSFDICIHKPTIINTGSVGVNTNNPQAKLDVNGGIRPGFTTNAIPGNIRWNTDLEVFDGTSWKSATEWDHDATQTIEMNGNRIADLATPVLPNDAVTKAYVDGISDTDNSPSNELQQLSIAGNNVTLSNGGGTITIDLDDADADPNNEIQSLILNGSDLSLSSSAAGSVSINDADANPNNEIQVMSLNNNNLTLSNGGGSINIDDGDSDDSNEIQVLSRPANSTNIELSNGGGFVNIEDDDSDDSNELQTITKSGIVVTLSNGGGAIDVADNDNSETNEIQFISKNGSQISITNGGVVGLNDDDASNEIQTLSRLGSSVFLSPSGGSANINDADSDSSNELQSLSKNGNLLTLSLGGGTYDISDADADISNELITASTLSGTDLTYTEAGVNHTVSLSNIASKWDNYGSKIYYNIGNVGIGVINADEKLDVRGTSQVLMNSSSASPQLQLVESVANDGARMNFQNSAETSNIWTLFGRADNTPSDNYFNLFHTIGGNILQVKGNGDVGINGSPDTELHLYHGNSGSSDGLKIENDGVVASPWWRLYVSSGSSDLRLFSKIQGNTIIGKFDDVTGTYAALSDRRKKESVQDLHFDWPSFMQLGAYSYKFIGAPNEKRSIGFMAQDVMQVYPELVDYVEDTDQYLMNYSGLGVVAIKAVQEQQKEIESLKSENESMKKELEEIRKLLEEVSRE